MTAVTFTGLSSGIDTASLVTQLVAAERAPTNQLASRQSDLATQKSIVGNLSTALAALGTAVRGLDLPGEAEPRKATASDGHVTVAASSGAIATVHSVRVQQLARNQITSSRTFDSADAGVLADGSVAITTGTTTATIGYTSADSLADIASRINASGVAASASVLFDGTSYRLMVTSTGTGSAGAAHFVDDGDGLALSDPDNITVEARDAIATIDGVDVTRSSNVIDDAVAGVTFTLVSPHAAADTTAAVTVALDRDGLHGKLAAIVGAYNAVNAAVHAQLDYSGTQRGSNTLFGDATLRQLQGALGTIMSNSYGPADPDASDAERAATGTTLGAIGLTRDRTGALTLDDAKLSAALAAHPGAVSDLFVTGGFAAAMTGLTDTYTRAGDGVLASKTAGLSARNKALQGSIDHINARADALKTQLEKQFTALETAMSQLKSQSAYLTSILG
jgi:flagellar hook-associated protein 2